MIREKIYLNKYESSCEGTIYIFKNRAFLSIKFQGKNTEADTSAGLCTRVVLDLMAGLEERGLELYTDNYYTSPDLYTTLYENACGTLRVNRRGFPKELVYERNRNEERGFYDYRSNGPLLATVWYDRQSIYFLSTVHSAEASDGTPVDVMRRNPDGSRVSVQCPPPLADYQAFMRGVDRGIR